MECNVLDKVYLSQLSVWTGQVSLRQVRRPCELRRRPVALGLWERRIHPGLHGLAGARGVPVINRGGMTLRGRLRRRWHQTQLCRLGVDVSSLSGGLEDSLRRRAEGVGRVTQLLSVPGVGLLLQTLGHRRC